MKKIIALIALFLIPLISHSQGLVAEGTEIVNSNGDPVLLRGYAPGGWLVMEGYMMQTSEFAGAQHQIKENLIELMGVDNTETFFSKWRENHFTQRDVDSLAAWGFNSIRIPMHYNLFTLPIEDEPIPGENTWIETGFELIEDVLEWSAPHNIYVILDMHATPGGQGAGSEINDYDPTKPSLWESQQNRDKLVALWTRIAERYKDNEWIGGYDLINETHWDLGQQNVLLREIYEDITAGIRGVGDEHIIYIEGNSYANDHTGLTPPWDDNLVYSFHKYWSFNTENDVDWITPLRDAYNVPLWMGESGENSNTWYTDAVSLFENNNIGWAWWSFRKIGNINSPYAIDVNPGYQTILDYWQGNAPQPTATEAFDGMMGLADNLLVENTRHRKDVPDALIRQVQTDETIPFNGSPFAIPGVVYLSDYDLGKINHAYYDTVEATYHLSTGNFTAWNAGWAYRNDGVDIERNSDNINSNGYHIGFVNEGEWIKYTVDIEQTAVYKAKIRVATQETGGEFFLTINDQEVTTTQVVSSTGGWTQFTTFEIDDIVLPQGEHSLKLHINNNTPANYSSIEFELTGNVEDLALNALNGKTGEDEATVEITISESVLASTLDGNEGDFSLNVNGEDRNIVSVTSHPTKERTFILNVEGILLIGDEILASYSGNTIQSESNKTLNTFTNLVINNVSPKRFIIPTLIPVEEYDFMLGMTLENTEDEGGGQNFGFTAPGDYADYSIYVPEGGLYRINFRVAGFSEGQVGLYTVDENDNETELVVVNTIITGGWQTWETVSSNLFIDEGPHKLRMKVLAGGFNFNWFRFDFFNNNDVTPDNYTVSVSSVTCRSEDNGSITLTAIENLEYSVSVTSENTTIIENFTSEVSFQNLPAGTYTLCITINGQPDYEQCFTVVVNQPDELIVTSGKKSINSSKIKVSLNGADVYFITLNNETFSTSQNEVELQLTEGENQLVVKTNLDCQGIYKKTYSYDAAPLVYPNPFQNTLFIVINELDVSTLTAEVYSLSGKLLIRKLFNTKYNQLEMNLSNLETGLFILKIVTNQKTHNYKIIKQ